MSDKLTNFLETTNPSDVLTGIYKLGANGQSPTPRDFQANTVSITVGSIPENSEYRKFVNRTQQAILDYQKDPEGYAKSWADRNFVPIEEARTKMAAHIQDNQKTLPGMLATLQRSDLVTIEFTGQNADSQGFAAYIEEYAGKGSVIDHGVFRIGIPDYRCGPQDYPEGLVITREAFEKVVQPLMASQEVANHPSLKGVVVQDTTPNDGKPTVNYGAKLGTARDAAGGCGR